MQQTQASSQTHPPTPEGSTSNTPSLNVIYQHYQDHASNPLKSIVKVNTKKAAAIHAGIKNLENQLQTLEISNMSYELPPFSRHQLKLTRNIQDTATQQATIQALNAGTKQVLESKINEKKELLAKLEQTFSKELQILKDHGIQVTNFSPSSVLNYEIDLTLASWSIKSSRDKSKKLDKQVKLEIQKEKNNQAKIISNREYSKLQSTIRSLQNKLSKNGQGTNSKKRAVVPNQKKKIPTVKTISNPSNKKKHSNSSTKSTEKSSKN